MAAKKAATEACAFGSSSLADVAAGSVTLLATERARASSAAAAAVLLDRGEEVDQVDGLRDVTVEACGEEPLTVAVHRLRGQRENSCLRGARVGSKLCECFHAVDPG